MPDNWKDEANAAYERAVFFADEEAIAHGERALDAEEAALALARGRFLHARFLASRTGDPKAEMAYFVRAAQLFASLGDQKGEADANMWLGVFHQVVERNAEAAAPPLARALALARAAGDRLIESYAARHLGFAARDAGRFGEARELLLLSAALRRTLGFTAGEAAAELALADLSFREGKVDEGTAAMERSRTLAESIGAKGVVEWISRVEQQWLADRKPR